jgi:HlyD family secretion protein
MSWSFRITVLVLVVALAGGAALAIRPQPLNVDVARATRAPLEQIVDDEGKARIRERYTISAPVAGTLARVELHEGDPVEPGTVVGRLLPLATPLLDPQARKAAEQRLASAVDALAQNRASVARAKAANDQAQTDAARIAALVKGGALPDAQRDQAMADARMRGAELASSEFASNVAEHEIAQARAALARFSPGVDRSDQFEITSPVHGRVLHVIHQNEGVVAAGAAILEVGDPAALELVADVLSQDAVAIEPGMPARIVHWGGPTPVAARVRRVEPAAFTKVSALGVDEQRVDVLLDPEGPAETWQPLGDGFAVEIEIVVWSKPDALQIPTSALFRSEESWSVFSVENGRARTRAVQVGHRGPLETEIVGGLQPGAPVIMHPGAAVREGASVSYR